MKWGKVPTSWGTFYAAWDGEGLRRLLFPNQRPPTDSFADSPLLRTLARELSGYLSGRGRGFSVRLAPQGTAFQLSVWRELLKVPYGALISYGELAARLGRSRAARAVGSAVGANPIPILIPCHRVIRADGKLGGFGPGVEWKRRLLELEGAIKTGRPSGRWRPAP